MFSSSVILAFALASVVSAQGSISGKCTGQTCYIASLGASTNEPYVLKGGKKPTGGNAMGDQCIKSAYKTLGLPPPAGLKRIVRGGSEDVELQYSPENDVDESTLRAYAAALERRERRSLSTIEKRIAEAEASPDLEPRAACTKNTLLFGRGTTEMGTMGGTVGPALAAKMGSGWTTEGISYDASLMGIYCIGMAGGLKCIDQINRLAERCPQTNIVLSGYSQGAMVARICAAWAGPKAKPLIKGLALFGDPFNGASVKGIDQKRVKTWCSNSDGVCKGQFSISAAHMSYTSNGDVTKAAAWIKEIAAT